MNSWICDGIPKDGKQYPNCSGEHEPYENFGPDCALCGLPKEAMKPGKHGKPGSSTTISQPSRMPVAPLIVAIAALIALGVGSFGLYQLISSQRRQGGPRENSPEMAAHSDKFVSETATNSQFFSQGEKILLGQTAEKQAGAKEFANRNWEGAIAAYQQAVSTDPNDPESKIYENNALARKAGNPLTIAAAVPLTTDAGATKEILRGIAQAQTELNQSPLAGGKLLEVVIVNYGSDLQAAAIAQDLVNAGSVLGVLGYGVNPASNQALRVYEQAGLATLSPLTTRVSQGTLQAIPTTEKVNELLGNYLQAAAKTLAQYASQRHPAPPAVIFFNSDSPYSLQLKQQLVNALPAVRGKVLKVIDISAGGFAAATEVASAKQLGAKVAFLALSKNKVEEAIAIAIANRDAGSSLLLLGGDELYNPDLLIRGGEAINGLVLAVPWSFQPGDPFAQQAVQNWKGRISWRTATAYDAAKALGDVARQNPSRSGVAQQLSQGVRLTGSATNFQTFKEVPLVQAVRGNSGPPGSQFQFDPVR